MGNVTALPVQYRYRVHSLIVGKAGRDDHGQLYEPTPDKTWSALRSLAWMAGVVQLEIGQPVTVRRNINNEMALGEFSLQIGDQGPITGLDANRLMDILGGCLMAAELLRR